MNYGSAGLASLAHLAAALFASDMGIELTHVPYKSSAQSSIDIITGRLDMQFATVGPTLENIRDGKLRALATTGSQARLVAAGRADHDGGRRARATTWRSGSAYVMPAGTPDAIVGKLNRAMNGILKEPEVVENLQKQGFEPDPGPPEAVTERIQRRNREMARAGGQDRHQAGVIQAGAISSPSFSAR